MKKEVLISLLMTPPVAFNAMADINTNEIPDATSNPDYYNSGWSTENFSVTDGKVVGTSFATFNKQLKSLAAGKYSFSVQSPVDVKLSITANGVTETAETKWIDTSSKVCSVEITLTEETDVTIEVASMNTTTGGFELEGINVKVVFDQDAAYEALNSALAAVSYGNATDVPATLTEKAEAFNQEKQSIQNRIDALKSTDDAALYNTYKTEHLNLYPDGDDISKAIKALSEKAETFKEEIAAETERLDIQTANETSYNNAMGAITGTDGLDAIYAQLTAKYTAENASVYAKGLIKDTYETLGKAINDYKDRIENTYKDKDGFIDDKKVGEFTPSEAEAKIKDDILQAIADFDAYTDDDLAYEYMASQLPILSAAYDKALLDITKVKGITAGLYIDENGNISFDHDYTNVYAEDQTKAKNDVTDFYNTANKAIAELPFAVLEEGETKTPDNIGGLNSKKEEFDKAVSTAKTAIENTVSKLQSLEKEQNDLMTEATASAKALNELLTEDVEWLGMGKDYKDENGKSKFPAAVEEKRLGYIADFHDGMKALSTAVASAYAGENEEKQHNLTANAYADTNENVVKVNTAIENLKKLSANDNQAAKDFYALNEQLSGIEKLIGEKDIALDNEEANFPFKETFDAALTQAKDKMANIVPTEGTDLTDLTNDLNDLKEHVEALYEAIHKANVSVNEVNKHVTAFETALEEKLYVEGIEPASKEYIAFYSDFSIVTKGQKQSLNKWKETFNDVKKEYDALCGMTSADQGNEVIAKANGLNDKFKEGGEYASYATQVDKDRNIVLTEISERNLAVADDKADAITNDLNNWIADADNKVPAEGLPGYGTDKKGSDYLKAIEDKITAIQTAIDAAQGQDNIVELLGEQDSAIQALIDGLITDKTKDAQALKDNHEAYLALTASIDAAQKAIDDSRAYNEEHSTTDGAKAYYSGLLDGYQTELGNLETEVKGAYEKGSAAGNATSQKDALTTALSDLEDKALNIQPTIDDNEQGYKDMVALSKEILGGLNAAYTSLSENSDFEAILDEIASDLNALDGESLADYEKGVFGDAGKTNNIAVAAAEVERLKIEYGKLRDRIDNALGDGLDKYNQGIKDANNEMFSTLWGGPDADLWEAYNKAIGDYQYYRDTNTNKSYKDYLADYIAQSAVIYDYYKVIRDLEDEINAYKNECNSKTAEREDYVLMDKEMFTGEGGYLARAEKIKADIATEVVELEASARTAAEKYYVEHTAAIGETITNATNAMAAAGVTAEYSEEAVLSTGVSTSLGEAQTAYGNGDDQVNAEDEYDKSGYLARRMHLIAGYLDDALTAAKAIDMQAAAKKEWTDVYAAASEKLGALKTQLDGCTSADEDIYDTSVEDLAEQIAAAAAINTEATADTDLINEKAEADNKVLGDYKAALEDAIKAATEAVDASQDSHDANVANEALYADYIADYDNLMLRYESLVDFVESLAADATVSDADIKAFYTAIDDTYRHSLAANESAIAALYNAASASISAGFQAAAESEIDWLNEELEVIHTAFNDARTKGGLTTEEADVYYNEKIANLAQNITDIESAIPAESGLNADAAIINLQEGMLNLEKAMCDLEAELNGLAGQDNRADAISDALIQACDDILTAIAAGETFVAGDDCNERTKADYEAGKFGDNYAGLKAEIEAVKAAIDADGNALIAHQGNFKASIDEIKKKVTDLTEAIYESDAQYDADDARATANQAAYEAITAEYEAAVSAWNETFERLVAYKYDQYVTTTEGGSTRVSISFSRIYQAIENAYADRTQQYDEGNGSLTEDDTLFADGYDVYAAIDRILSSATEDELTGWISAAKSAVSTAQTTLPTNIVSDVRAEIVVELANLAIRANALESTYTNAEDEVEAWAPTHIDEADRRLDEAKAIIDAVAEQNALAEENTFVIGDINVDKNVDAIDFQMMVNLIGNDFDGTAYETEELIVREAADINGNRMFDAGDLVAIADICMNYNPWGVRAAMFAPAVQGDNHVGLQLVSEENGISRYAVEITNAATFVAGQMNILVPAGMEVVEISTADRANAQDLYRFDNSNGNVRLVLASMNNEAIEGNQGAVVYIDVTGRGRLDIDNVIFADARGVIYTLSKDLTGVNSPLIDTLRNAKEAIYNVAGQAMDSLRRGFNIVRKSDGTTSKEYRK